MTSPRLELDRPAGGRIPAYIENGRLFSQCATVSPNVPVYVVYAAEDKSRALVEKLTARMGYKRVVVEVLPPVPEEIVYHI